MNKKKEVKLAAQKTFEQYQKTFKDLAPYDNEEFIETYKAESDLESLFKIIALTTLLFTLIYFTAHVIVWVMR